jgi:hypothetical protein
VCIVVVFFVVFLLMTDTEVPFVDKFYSLPILPKSYDRALNRFPLYTLCASYAQHQASSKLHVPIHSP